MHHGTTSDNTATRDRVLFVLCFFFNDTATTEIYTLSLHDALPISPSCSSVPPSCAGVPPSCAGSPPSGDRKSTRLNSSHLAISYAVFCLKKKYREAPFAPRCDCGLLSGAGVRDSRLCVSDYRAGAERVAAGDVLRAPLSVVFFFSMMGRPRRPPFFPTARLHQ